MKREIKFRTYSKQSGVMEYITLEELADGDRFDFAWKDYEWMQFTGLHDKNGKEIYEGDVVKWSDGGYVHPSNPRIAEVRFEPELCFFAFNVDKESGGHKFGYSNFAYSDTENHLEIVGNIWENPELITNN